MIYFVHFFLGFASSFLGTIAPSMLNMTAAKISVQQGKTKAVKFAIGVSLIVFIQAYVAILFTQYLRANPLFVESLQKIALVIFMALAIYFYRQYKKDKVSSGQQNKKDYKSSFMIGLLLSALNMFAIPFYCGITTALDVAGWFEFSQSYILTFVIGSALGTFSLLYVYLNYAKNIKLKASGMSKNLNLILSILTAVLAVVTMIKLI